LYRELIILTLNRVNESCVDLTTAPLQSLKVFFSLFTLILYLYLF